MNSRRLFIPAFLILLYVGSIVCTFCVFYLDKNTVNPTTDKPKQEETVVYVSFVDTTSNRKTNFYQCDATSKNIYFSYSQDNCVDVYSNNGDFCFTIHLPQYPKGAVMIRCANDILYIRDKTDKVYVYSGSSKIDEFSKLQAEMLGYDYNWFRNNSEEIRVGVNRDFITLADESGLILTSLETPNSIRQNLPLWDFDNSASITISLLGILGLAIFCGSLMYRSIRESNSKPSYRLN